MKKSSSNVKNKRKTKNFSFFTRITTLFIIVAAIIVSTVFSFNYLSNNGNLSIEFAGGYQTQVKYDGVYDKDNKTQNIVNLLESRVDPLGTSNINIEKNTNTGNFYNVSISKSAGIDLPIFINNIVRRGYVYLLDGNGHDLLASDFDSKTSTWKAKDKRIIVSEAFSKIYQDTNFNSGQPEVVFTIKDQNLMKVIQEVIQSTGQVYFYSDLGGLLNYVRSNLTGLKTLIKFIEEETNPTKQKELKVLLANDTPGFDDIDGVKMYDAVKRSDSKLINLLNQSKNGVYSIKWRYSDALNSNYSLSVDTNEEENVLNPENPFDPNNEKSSPLNVWLPHIKDLIILSDISRALDTSIINYKYAPYYIGNIGMTNINGNKITINDDTFNKEKVQQIVNLLNVGKEKNNFSVISVLNVDPTLGAQSLKLAIIGLLVSLIILSIAMIFNYRLLGVSAVLIIILFLVFTLVTFTFLNNIMAPETGIALIIGFALLLDTIIGLFNNIKKEYKTGKTIFDAFKVANKKSLVSAFDCSIIVLIVSLTIFWFGSRSIRGFAIMTSLSTFGVIIFGVLFLRLVLYLLLKNNTFEKRPDLLALKQYKPVNNRSLNTVDIISTTNINSNNQDIANLDAKEQDTIKSKKVYKKKNFFHISQWNFWYKSSKWVMIAFSIILFSSGISYLALGANFGSGFDSRIDFTGETTYEKSPTDDDFDLWKHAEELKNEVKATLNENNKSYQKIYASLILDSLGQGNDVIKIIIETNLKESQANNFREFLSFNHSELSWIYAGTDALSGSQLFKDMIIVIIISLIPIFLYIIIRFQLTFTIPLIIVLSLAVLLTLALVTLLHITISTMTIGVILALVILVLINSVVIFDNIKEIKLNNYEKQNKLEKKEIISISNKGIKKSLLRTLSVNSIIILTALIVLCFLPSLWSVSLGLIIATIVTFIVSHFIGPWLWTFFEIWRIKRYEKRVQKIKENFDGPDEYIIEGIND